MITLAVGIINYDLYWKIIYCYVITPNPNTIFSSSFTVGPYHNYTVFLKVGYHCTITWSGMSVTKEWNAFQIA